MTARRATPADLDWIVELLGERRARLVRHAPIFWRPAAESRGRHRAFIDHLLTDAGTRAYRTDNAVLIAAPRGDGWLVDDAYVRDEQWSEGQEWMALWNAFARDCGGAQVRFVCPTYEYDRAAFAARDGLAVGESWWLKELSGSGGESGLNVELPGADAVTVEAPPVYAPPGPVLFLPAPTDATTAVPAALDKADELGCAAVVVNQAAEDDDLAAPLIESGLRRHCDYFAGTIKTL